MVTTGSLVYRERVSSNRTETLFLVLTILFLMLLIWRDNTGSADVRSAVDNLQHAVRGLLSGNHIRDYQPMSNLDM
jgi:hypothetical protein